MKEIVDTVEKESGSTSGNTIGNTFDKIVFGMKMIPNMDQSKNLMKILKMVGGAESGYTGVDDGVDYDMDALGDLSSYPKFFEWNGAYQTTFP